MKCKKFIFIQFCIITFLLPHYVAAQAKLESKGPKKRVAIVDFVNKTNYGANKLSEAASDILLTELAKSGQFIMIEREKLNLLLKEQGLGMSGIVNPNTAAQTGKILGLNAIVTGSISQFGEKKESGGIIIKTKKRIAECTVDVRIIDVNTGQIKYADSGTGETEVSKKTFLSGAKPKYDQTIADKALRAATVKFIDNLIQQLNSVEWSGKIAKVDGERIFVNAGQETGLRVGDKLVVRSLGEEIIDPDTGLSMGKAPGRMKGKLEIIALFGEDGSIAAIVSGSGFQRGDQVKLE